MECKKNNEKSESVIVRKQFKTHGKFLKPSSYYKGNNLQHSVVNNYETQSRNSRAVALSTHVCLRMRREREPSRISFKIVTKLFKRKRKRKAVEFYLNKCIPTSSVIKVMLFGYIRNQFFDRCRRWETVIYPQNRFIRYGFNFVVVRLRTLKHKKSPWFWMYCNGNIPPKLRQLDIKTYHLSNRIISLSGDVELNPGPTDQYYNAMSRSSLSTNSVSLLETRLAQLGRTALDVGGDGDCFFRAVSHQIYGNPNNHFYVRSVGVQYLVHNPEQFIESNTEYSWQHYLTQMSRPGTWADAIIIQAVANCLNLSIHIAESNPVFSPLTVVEPINVTTGTQEIVIGHVDEIHYVSTSNIQRKYGNRETTESRKKEAAQKTKLNLEHEREIKLRSFRKRKEHNPEHIREINKQSAKNRKQNNPHHVQEINKQPTRKRKENNPEYVREINKQSARNRKQNDPEHVREINKESARKRKENNLVHVREVNKQSIRKKKENNREHVQKVNKQSTRKRKKDNPDHVREINKESVRKRTENNPEHIREINKESVRKRKKKDPEHIREINKESVRKRKENDPEHIREINTQSVRKRKQNNIERVQEIDKQSFKKRKANNPEHIKQINRKSKEKLKKVSYFQTSDVFHDPLFQEVPSTASKFTDATDELQGQNNKNKATLMINLFHKNIGQGPEFICTCCDQMWYKSSVIKCDANRYKTCSQNIVKSCVTGFKSVNDTEWICITCNSNLKKGKVPSCSKANKMGFPDKPDLLNLTPLEERLISPRIPFMQIRELPRGGQLSIHGNIVNVPSDVNSTVHCLPRSLSESQTIPIKLKRRLNYKHHYQFQNVRPQRVLDAAKYLVETSDLFKDEGIEVQNTFINDINSSNREDWQEFVQNPSEKMNKILPKDNAERESNSNTSNVPSEVLYDTDDWCEVEERPAGVTDTLLEQTNVAENADKIISFAPGEGNKPLGIFLDKDSEYLSFPSIFCGKRRPENNERQVPVSYSTVAKWELRSRDRRAAMSVPNIFYKLKKLQIKQIQDSACISLRKCKMKGKHYTAGDLKSENYLNKLIHLDEGFRVLKNVRGSPPYFEKCKKDLFAMIRQLGNPTWFSSFSAAETRWSHLLKTLGKIVRKKEYSNEEIKEMSWEQKSDLIQKDPVTCARNFEHMVQLFIRDVLKSSIMPIGEITDYFYRVEFQQRGSPHIHGLFWIKNAPQYEKDSNENVVTFVDKFISCHKPNRTSEMEDLVNLQMHRHAKTCKKGGNKICRFKFPIPPMPKTIILKRFDDCYYDEQKNKVIKENSEKIKLVLDNMKFGEDITFEDLLKKLQLTQESYLLAIRYTLKRDTLFLKRSPSEIRNNSYNTHLLQAWQANMDIQYVLDPYMHVLHTYCLTLQKASEV